MRILKITGKNLPRFKEDVVVDFTPIQRVLKEKNEMLTQVSPKIYTNNAISFFGINASGKSTTLNMISFVMKMLNGEVINNIDVEYNLKDLEIGAVAVFETIFYSDNNVYKLVTEIVACENSISGGRFLKISTETLYKKKMSSVTSKIKLDTFCDKDKNQTRDNDAAFLLPDVSIIIALHKESDGKILIYDLVKWTDINTIRILCNFPLELVQFLDPNIDHIKIVPGENKEQTINIELQFKGKSPISIKSLSDLHGYLSSGTIKGINLFLLAFAIWENGGYLIVDEIENHFNVEIVSTLIRFFCDSSINVGGGTIVFSTHYMELLDIIDRNDSIYFVKNVGGITTENFSTILTRDDKKRSDFIMSGVFRNFMPEYNNYINFKRSVPCYKMMRGDWKNDT